MKDDITLIMYSHSTYSDVWPIFFKQSNKYLKNYKKVLFTDDDLGKLPEGWSSVLYDDSLNYAERMTKCLLQIKTPLTFLHHEDMPLYSEPDYDLLNSYEDIVMNDDIDFIRLLRSTDPCLFNYKGNKTLYPASKNSPYYFAVQPSIFKTTSLLEIYANTEIQHISQFEPNAQNICKIMSINGIFHYNGESKRGQMHYDSDAYPYICTAVSAGKWNLTEYPDELGRMLEENNIDKNIRGII